VDTYTDLSANQTVTIIEDNAILSNQDLQNLSTLQVYPNPVTDLVNVQLSDQHITGLKLYNVLGQLVLEQELDRSTTVLNLANLQAGVYLLKIQGETNSFTNRLVKH
jgi:hypothetical protein